MNTIEKTESICPECLKLLPADIFERDGKVFIKKKCPRHGSFEDLYWGSYEMYNRAKKFARDGRGIKNPTVKGRIKCPFDCGLCSEHKSHTALANIAVTNRCDLRCWYCFFFAQKMGYVYEPTKEQIREMVKNLRSEKPVPCNAVQLTGGEPCLREDLTDIIKIIKDGGIDHVQVNTDGIRLSQDPDLAKRIRQAGVNTIYLSFDGVTAKTNPKNHYEALSAIENCRKADMGIVLVPTVIRTVNDHELGDILRFGFGNMDVIRGVNFQPVSLVGRMPRKARDKYRITIPDAIQRIEEQTNGEICKDDFYPVPSIISVSRFIEAITKKAEYEMSSHFACGMATYVFKDGKKIIPITRFVDVEGLMEYLDEKSYEIMSGKSKYWVGMKFLYKLRSFIDKEKQPEGIDIASIIYKAILRHDYRALGVFHHKSLLIGMMHFQDLYNYDIERVKRCCIHYATPDKKMPIVPFCTFNVMPRLYRDKIQKKYSLPIKQWEKKTGKKLEEDFYIRTKTRAR
jgi:uncharacterized radical SAM superfamily Fe-S cluster-containing enzyme